MDRGVDPTKLGDIVGKLYDNCLDGSDWTGTAQSIFRLLGAHAGQLWTPSFLQKEGGGIDVGEIVNDPKIRADYASYYHRHDIWYLRSVERGLIANGRVLTDDMLVTEREYRGSEFWGDFLRPTECVRMCTGIVLGGDPGDPPMVSLTLFRGPRAPLFGKEEQRVVEHLLPHLRRALVTRLGLAPAAASPAELALERLTLPVAVVDRDATVLFINPAAERLLKASRALMLRERRLRLIDGSRQRRFEELLRHAEIGHTCLPANQAASLRCGDLTHDGLTLSVVPLRQPAGNARAVAMIILRAPLSEPVSEAEIRAAYGLTPAEGKLAAMLARGETLETIALIRSVSVNTVRTQLRSVLQKTRSARQADLVRLLISRHTPLA